MDPPLEQFLATQPVPKRRASMPKLEEEELKPPSVISMIKEYVGTELGQPLPAPIQYSEPSAELMKRAEDIEYSELLDEAAELPKGSLQRLMKVAAYVLSPYSACHADRTTKPMLSGPRETLEAVYPEKGVRYLAESIQDDGWIVATHMEGRKWTLATDDQHRPKISGHSLKVVVQEYIPNWFLELTFHDGEMFTWTKGATFVHNIVAGDMFVSHRGHLKVHQAASKRVAIIKFKDPGLATLSRKGRKTANRPVSGYVEENGKKLANPRFAGFWDSQLDAVEDGKVVATLWKANPLPPNNNRFNLTTFMMGLTERQPSLLKLLPPTDSRMRKDTLALEHGRYKQADQLKEAAEERMYAEIEASQINGRPFIKPTWFKPVPNRELVKPGEGIRWRYSGRYWAARENGFAGLNLPRIYE